MMEAAASLKGNQKCLNRKYSCAKMRMAWQSKFLKTYDRSFAREVFGEVDGEALKALAAALDIEENYEKADIPAADGSEYEDFLWEELCEAAREDVRQDPNLYSFFVVSETCAGKTKDLYFSRLA